MPENDKAELLSQLTIDKSMEENATTPWAVLVVTGFICLVGGGILGYTLASQKAPATSPVIVQQSPPKVTTLTPQPKKASEEILNASGYINARRIATVSSEISGLIANVEVEEGVYVEKGQVLAQLDNAVAKVNLDLAHAQVDVQKARVTNMETQLREAKRILTRVSKLEGVSFSSEAQLTKAETDVDSLTANVASARADLKVAQFNVARLQENYNRHTIRAPFPGVVTVKNAQPGEIIAPAAAGGGFTRTGICTIVDMTSLEIEVDVNEAYINRVYSGQKVVANLDAYPDWDIPASVIAVIPTAIRAKATVQVRIKLENKDQRILPDMGVKVAFLK